jgi:excisionase family DNA binding protein
MALTRLYTVPETAEALKVTEAAIRRWIFERRLTIVKIGSAVRIEEAELAVSSRQAVNHGGRPFEDRARRRRRRADQLDQERVCHSSQWPPSSRALALEP